LSSRHSRSLLLAARFVLLVGVMLSMAGFWQATHISRQAEEDRMTGAFLLDASDRFEMVGRELDRSAGAVHALRNFFMASREVSDEEFRTFGQPVLDRRPELHALFWMPAEGTIDAPRFPVRQVATKDGSTRLLGQDLAPSPTSARPWSGPAMAASWSPSCAPRFAPGSASSSASCSSCRSMPGHTTPRMSERGARACAAS